MGHSIHGLKDEPRIAWVAVTLHFPWNTNAGLRKNYLAKWLHECRKSTGLNLAYIGAMFKKGRTHHAHLTLFGVNKLVGFDIKGADRNKLEELWYRVTRLKKKFRAALIETKEDYATWNQGYIFEKNAREADDFEIVFHNTRLLRKAGLRISKPKHKEEVPND